MHTASSSLATVDGPAAPQWSSKPGKSLSADDIYVAKETGDRSYLTGGRSFDTIAEEAIARGQQAPKSIQDRVEQQALNNDLTGRSVFRREYFDRLVKRMTPRRLRQRGMTEEEKMNDDLARVQENINRRQQNKDNKILKKIKKEEKKDIKRAKKDQKKHEKHIKKQTRLDQKTLEKQKKIDEKYGQEASARARSKDYPPEDMKIADMTPYQYRQLMQGEAYWMSRPKPSRKQKVKRFVVNALISSTAIGLISGVPLWFVHAMIQCKKDSGGMTYEIYWACIVRSPDTVQELTNQWLNETMNGTLPDEGKERADFRNTIQQALLNTSRYIQNADEETKRKLEAQDDEIRHMNTALTMLRNELRYGEPGMHVTRNGGVPEEYAKLAFNFPVDIIWKAAQVSEEWFWSHYDLMTKCSDYTEALVEWIQESHTQWAAKIVLLNNYIFKSALFQAKKYGYKDFSYRAFQNGLTNCELPMDPPDDYIADPNPEDIWDIQIPDHIRRLSRLSRHKRSTHFDSPAPDTSAVTNALQTLASYELTYPETQRRLRNGNLSYITTDEWYKYNDVDSAPPTQPPYLAMIICTTIVVIVMAILVARVYIARSTITPEKDAYLREPLSPIIRPDAKVTEKSPLSTAV